MKFRLVHGVTALAAAIFHGVVVGKVISRASVDVVVVAERLGRCGDVEAKTFLTITPPYRRPIRGPALLLVICILAATILPFHPPHLRVLGRHAATGNGQSTTFYARSAVDTMAKA